MTEPPEQPDPHANNEKPDDEPNEEQRPTRGDYAKLLLVLLAVACFFGMLIFRHPTDYGVIPPCPFHSGTGFLCPGCGSMRATHYFVTGHWLASLRNNPLVAIMLPLLAYAGLQWFCDVFLHRKLPFPYQTTVYWIVAAVFVVFFITRNIPLDCFEILRPPPRVH